MTTDAEVTAADLATVNAEHARRIRAVDALLPAPAQLRAPTGGGVLRMARVGDAAAVGVMARERLDPLSLAATWGQLDQHRLAMRVAGPDVAAAVDALLSDWRRHVTTCASPGERDSAALVAWPSRDTAVADALTQHGLVPRTVIAVRRAGLARPGTINPNVRIRVARPDDVGTIVRMRMAEVRYDAQFGVVTERSSTVGRLCELTAQTLGRPEPWTWLAERGGRPVGLATVDPPGDAGWIAGMTSAAPAAYLDCLSVDEGVRGSGVGTALATRAHRVLDDAGVAATLLHHALPNPLSTPFWYRHGYRPLWTMWQARPAAALC